MALIPNVRLATLADVISQAVRAMEQGKAADAADLGLGSRCGACMDAGLHGNVVVTLPGLRLAEQNWLDLFLDAAVCDRRAASPGYM